MDLGMEGGDSLPSGYEDPLLSSASDILTAPTFLAAALQLARVGTWHFDFVSGVASFDRVATEIFGVASLQMSVDGLPLLHPDDRAIVENRLSSSSLLEHEEIEFRIVRPDGGIRWVRTKGHRVEAKEEPVAAYVGVAIDITEQMTSAQNLRDADERYRMISQVITDAVFEWDIVRDKITWNETISPFFGNLIHQISSIDALSRNIHPDDQSLVKEEFKRLFAARKEHYEAEHRILSKNGEYLEAHACGRVLYDASGMPVRLIGSFRDVSEERQAHAALRESEAINRGIVEASSDSVVLLDLEGKILFLNRSHDILGEGSEFTVPYGKEWIEAWPQYAKPKLVEAVEMAKAGSIGRVTDQFELGGKLRWMEITVSPIRDDAGKPIKLVVFARDVSQRWEADEKLRRAATYDSLTNLPNRASFQERLTQAFAEMEKNQKRLGLLLLDVDDFKQVNDSLGHDAGDALLREIANRIEIPSVPSQAVARVGGDEFAVLLENLDSSAEIRRHADAILGRMKEPIVYNGRALDCQVTIGAALFPEDGCTPDDLLKSADIALYVGKAEARGELSMFEQKHRAGLRERIEMVSVARSAVKEGRVLPFYQPKCALRDRSIQGFEALLRWRHPTLGVQLPATISAAFEDLDVATLISRKMLELVISDMREWLDEGLNFGHVAINAGEAEFRRDGFAEALLGKLYASQIPPRYLQLEVTETVFLGQGADCVERALKMLDQEGVRIALDDFGTGYASLRHLKQFPVHVMKIDQGFVQGMGANAEDVAIISAVVNLGKRLGLDVIAEGIETEKQEERLRQLGCEFGQGYLYSRAVPASEVPKMLRRATLKPAAQSV